MLPGGAATNLSAPRGSSVSLHRCFEGLAPPLLGSAVSCVPATSRWHPHFHRRTSSRRDGSLDLARGPARKSGPAHSMYCRPPPLLLALGPWYRPQAVDARGGVLSLGLPRNAAWSINGAWNAPYPRRAPTLTAARHPSSYHCSVGIPPSPGSSKCGRPPQPTPPQPK
ncbi:hypothetical protein NDU88_003156 [Pleurodeles waltl]|uniref:Uncharacterized protein n=1 Tax=Pleurodeles waltl TaxID=8319 RepID=A0AAV7LEI0_PLEWA|nr:hypothetical protein NDU88_003156 [Pleurodeles waltl]